MAHVIMKKTVYDGKVYHRAGESVEITEEKAKMYIERGYAVVKSAPKAEIKIEEPAETKEEKIVYKKKKK